MIKVLNYTKNPLMEIGKAASICYDSITLEEIIANAKTKKAIGIAKHCLNSGHTRVAEFADVTLLIDAYSARVIREFYTHVIGTSRVQASTRYIKYKDLKFGYYVPNSIKKNKEAKLIYDDCMDNILDSYSRLLELGIPQQDAANVLPLGHNTTIVCKINLRALMHMFEVRTCTRAYEEYRKLMKELKDVVKNLDEQWLFLCEKHFKTKCEKMMYCDEGQTCGRFPSRVEFEEIIELGKKTKKELELNGFNG